ncbi:MAG: FG-GAP repeat protein [Deltaproteobacteria bacterium]|nr:FG-GAP repeat protein [Deltaproteobacteria bacterium]
MKDHQAKNISVKKSSASCFCRPASRPDKRLQAFGRIAHAGRLLALLGLLLLSLTLGGQTANAAGGLVTSGARIFGQGLDGLVGNNENGDNFGAVIASGDFNGDGYPDVVIGSPDEALNADPATGVVTVIYGSSNGLEIASVAGHPLAKQYWQSNIGTAWQAGCRFGAALAVGDFNADGYADLAVGSPDYDVSGYSNAGMVDIKYGSASGLDGGGHLALNCSGNSRVYGSGFQFGYALVAGDFNGDGADELAVGVPNCWYDSGAVNVFLGVPGSGLTTSGNFIFYEGEAGIAGDLGADHFGKSLACGDFNADGYDDLVVGKPDETPDGTSSAGAGALNFIYGSSDGLYQGGYDNEEITNVGLGPEFYGSNYHFATALATGDFNGDGRSDLVVGQPGSDINSGQNSGRIFIYLGTGLSYVHSYTALDMESSFFGSHSAFGSSLSTGDFNGDGFDDIAVGVPGDATETGGVAVIYCDGNWSTPVTQSFIQEENGLIPENIYDSAQANDRFGAAVAAADFNNDGCSELAIGLPGASANDSATRGGGVIILDSPADSSRLVVEPDEQIAFTTMTGVLPDEVPLILSSSDENNVTWESKVFSNEEDMLVIQPASGEAPENGMPVKVMLNFDWFSSKTGGVYEAVLVFRDPTTGIDLKTFTVTATINRILRVGTGQDFSTIQPAIDAAIDGDVVLISNGTYSGTDNVNLQLDGKQITVKGETGTVIHCNHVADTRAFNLNAGETPKTVIQSLTVTYGSIDQGAGIYVGSGSSPTLTDITFSSNHAIEGAGLYYAGSSGRILNCRFNSNESSEKGGGALITGNLNLISGCAFNGNRAVEGGGIFFESGDANQVDNSDFVSNSGVGGYGSDPTVYCRGGAICSSESKLLISNSFFKFNHTQKYDLGEYNAGGAVFLGNADEHVIVNSIFSNNYVTDGNGNGGAICCLGEGFTIVNCTLFNNQASVHGDGIYYTKQSGRIVNTVIWEDSSYGICESIATDSYTPDAIAEINAVRATGTVLNADLSDGKCNICQWFINTEYIPNENGTDPLPSPFVAPLPGNDDFRLIPSSDPDKEYLLDQGTNVDWLYSDYRGSLRPIDGDNDGSDKFDIGALEYSLYYGGSTADSVTSAWKDLRLISDSVVIRQPYEIMWQDKAPFPDLYLKIMQSGEYRVNIALVSPEGYRVNLFENELIEVSQTGYKLPFTFGPEHIGTWQLRLEFAEDPNLCAFSEEIKIQFKDTVPYTLGQEIRPPDGAYPEQKPDFDDPEACYWSVNSKKLFATAARFVIITWYADENRSVPIPVVATIDYPESGYLTHIAETPAVDVMPAGTVYDLVQLKYASNDARLSANAFSATQEGWSLLYQVDNDTDTEKFKVVRTLKWDNTEVLAPNVPADIGVELTGAAYSHDAANGAGYVMFEKSPYDGYGSSAAYDRASRSGQIFPVNQVVNNAGVPAIAATPIDDLVVIWYNADVDGISWPAKPVRYNLQWPAGADKIVIDNKLGGRELDPAVYGAADDMQIYNQPDRGQPGCNPNEEHAMFFPALGSSFPAVYALRDDLNDAGKTSAAYALLKYRDPLNGKWQMKVWQVVDSEAVNPETPFSYDVDAGNEVLPPYPLNQMVFGPREESSLSETAPPTNSHRDKDGKIFAISGGTEISAKFFYKLQEGFWYDHDYDGNNDVGNGTLIAWLDDWNGTPQVVTYNVVWPADVPVLHIGETLVEAKNGLPDIAAQCEIDIIYQEGSLVNLFDPLDEWAIDCNQSLLSLARTFDLSTRRELFTDLPPHIQNRLTYDPEDSKLMLKGVYDAGTGEPTLLLNVLSDRELDQVKTAAGDNPSFNTVLGNLNSHASGGATLAGDYDLKALSAGNADGEGYVTLAFNDSEDCPAPTMLSVIKVECPLYTGEIDIFASDNPFDEKVTMRHNGDFGGNSDNKQFQWQYMLTSDASGIPDQDDEGDWKPYETLSPAAVLVDRGTEEGNFFIAANDTVIAGSSADLIADKWFRLRYYDPQAEGLCSSAYSDWTPPQLYEGWIKRVMKNINLFDQKIKDFHATDVDTLASMVSLAGPGYEGAVALSTDPDYLQNVGIIELYETLLERAVGLMDGSPDINNGIMFAANRLADLYMLLGNEAYADACDPTIGFSTESGVYGSEAPSIFCFQNQMTSLLEEELALLRGRSVNVDSRPVYNRLYWNFTLGDGEVAYAENYNIFDQPTVDTDNDTYADERDGEINEDDAKVQFPQGHGDAWGYYLSAVKRYYYLLKKENFTWVPRSEAIIVADLPVEVDYQDERKFAVAAAAKARAGSEIVDLTYRQFYEENSEDRWQGYPDNTADRDWGVDDWARRAGQGALFDWVVGNALLPPESSEEGIQKVDRTTVMELAEIASEYLAVETQLDKADAGLNPLGLAAEVMPFDIDPTRIDAGETHFEQIYGRAVQAANNAIAVFNHANESSQLLRRQQDSLEDFQRNIENMEADYNNRLIEIFGYPYPDDCGSGKTYAADYDESGPDLYHFMYIDQSELMVWEDEITTVVLPVTFAEFGVDSSGALNTTTKEVDFHISTDSRIGLVKPVEWVGRRKAQGAIQASLSEILQTRGRMEKALLDYDNLLKQIEDQADLLQRQYAMNRDEIYILNAALDEQKDLNKLIMVSRGVQLFYRLMSRLATELSNAIAEALPRSVGCANDISSVPRSIIRVAGIFAAETAGTAADIASLAELGLQQAKEVVSAESNLAITALHSAYAAYQQLKQLESLVRTEASQRAEIYLLGETLRQSVERYRSTLAQGDRLLADRKRFRTQTAAQIQAYRYKDMAFRIFRNDALQKYRAQFDMAAMYVYLAAKAYDYETTLLDGDSAAGSQFLGNIVKQRSIGRIESGLPLTGTGLADPMKRMWQNFQVIKPQLGFTNPQIETNRFSLRQELFRIKTDLGSNATWKQVLEQCKVENLWDVPEFRRYCRPFAEEGIAEPGIVIPFSTTVNAGMNFFHWPLGGGDSYYSSSNFATKVRSVGIWFSNYNGTGMSLTPRVYLVPVGEDILRTPSYNTREIRTWNVVDQKIPQPFPIVPLEMEENPSWIPTIDTTYDEIFEIRRHSDFRAYHDSGWLNESEMLYDSRLVGRSVWNTKWLLIIPGRALLADGDEGIETFIDGPLLYGGLPNERTGYGVSDIKLFFSTYAYSGN